MIIREGEEVLLLESNKLKILAATISNINVSNSLLQHIIDLHPADITDLLKTLCKEEYLIANGIGRGTTYSINYNREKLTREDRNIDHANSGNNKEFGRIDAVKYYNNNTTSNATSNTTSNATSKQVKRYSYKELSKLVIGASSSWKSAHEIARTVLKSTDHIRSNILPRMIKDGYLEMLDKQNLNSPLQKYRATVKGKQLL